MDLFVICRMHSYPNTHIWLVFEKISASIDWRNSLGISGNCAKMEELPRAMHDHQQRSQLS
ncbi:MAG: hypothetical protein DRG73_07560 [Deltaproteobacteria bacterium]|nr:MAG: hypothetical protein DRG73_07560 [Deltaproteobacteria bacterium]